MKALLNLIVPGKGKVFINTVEADKYKYIIGYVPQDNQLLPWQTLRENVDLWRKESGNKKPFITDDILELMELADHGHKHPSNLSGGMQRRASLARGLATQTEILCLDEVLVSIERGLRKKIMMQMRKYIKKNNISAILISHDYEEAVYMSDRIYVLSAAPTEILKTINILEAERDLSFFDSDAFESYAQKMVS